MIATTGKVNLSRREINMQIGDLFILRINIHLQGSVLDSPELMWAEPQLDPIYQAVRSYLEMDQRVQLLTERLEVIADLLAVLKDQLTSTHGEFLEWIGECLQQEPCGLLWGVSRLMYASDCPDRSGNSGGCHQHCRRSIRWSGVVELSRSASRRSFHVMLRSSVFFHVQIPRLSELMPRLY